MNSSLIVWSENQQIGKLSVNQGRWQFEYTAEWISLNNNFAISPHLLLQQSEFIDTTDDKRVEWFFENLLPEGGMREALARNANLFEKDTFNLLKRYGEESAGALTLLPENIPFPQNKDYIRLETEDLRERIKTSADKPLLISSDNLHMSLAGVQNKLGVMWKENEFYLPQQAAASSHIIKPENSNPTFPYCPANEFFCMQLAAEMKLSVPDTNLLHLPEPIFLITRFDRIIKKESVQRIHQIDLCQLLNKWVGYKYESHGGITSQDLFQIIVQLVQPATDRGQIIIWIIFNYIIGNTDAHGKNLSFLVNKNGISLAPFYDLLCVQTYLSESTLAMSINGENKPGWIEAQHWQALAKEAGVPEQLVFSYLKRFVDNIEKTTHKILSLNQFTDEEIEFLENSVMPVIQQRVKFINSALR